MIKTTLMLILFSTLFGYISFANATENYTATTKRTPPTHYVAAHVAPAPAKPRPCEMIFSACETAGYVRGGENNTPPNDVFENCFKPILSGQTITGISIAPAVIHECIAHLERENQMNNRPENNRPGENRSEENKSE